MGLIEKIRISERIGNDFMNVSFSSDSGQTFQYSSLDKCFSLQVTSIVKQVS